MPRSLGPLIGENPAKSSSKSSHRAINRLPKADPPTAASYSHATKSNLSSKHIAMPALVYGGSIRDDIAMETAPMAPAIGEGCGHAAVSALGPELPGRSN